MYDDGLLLRQFFDLLYNKRGKSDLDCSFSRYLQIVVSELRNGIGQLSFNAFLLSPDPPNGLDKAIFNREIFGRHIGYFLIDNVTW